MHYIKMKWTRFFIRLAFRPLLPELSALSFALGLRSRFRYDTSTMFHFDASFTKEGAWYVARAVEFGVTTQGKTLEAAKKNLLEAVELFLQ